MQAYGGYNPNPYGLGNQPQNNAIANNANQGGSFEVYKKIKLLGQGAFGKAFLVECQSDKTLAVIKQVDIGGMSERERQDTLKEAKILEVFNHPNIVRFREVYKTKKGKLCIVMDFADGGDLQQMIKNQRGRYFSENQILDWFTQIGLAMKHIHDRKVLHRDIKCQNVFLTSQNLIKMGDFGIARVLNNTCEVAKSMVGTPYYLSPEIIQGRPYSFKSDIWSLGVMFYELCALKPPFDGTNIHFLGMKIVKGEYSPLPSHFSREIKTLISQMLTLDVQKRLNINQILKTPIIARRIKQFLNEDVFKDEFSHTILHKHNVMVHGPYSKPPQAQLPQLDKNNLQRQPSAPLIPPSNVMGRNNNIPQSATPQNYNKPNINQQQQQQQQPPAQMFGKQPSPGRNGGVSPINQQQQPLGNIFNNRNQQQVQQKQPDPKNIQNNRFDIGGANVNINVNINNGDKSPVGGNNPLNRDVSPIAGQNNKLGGGYNYFGGAAQNPVDRFEQERKEKLERQEKEKREKEEKHKAMLDDIKKKKEEYKAVKQPFAYNPPSALGNQNPPNSNRNESNDIKDQIAGVRNRINDLYNRQNSAQSQLKTPQDKSHSPSGVNISEDIQIIGKNPRNVFDNQRDKTPPKQPIVNLRHRAVSAQQLLEDEANNKRDVSPRPAFGKMNPGNVQKTPTHAQQSDKKDKQKVEGGKQQYIDQQYADYVKQLNSVLDNAGNNGEQDDDEDNNEDDNNDEVQDNCKIVDQLLKGAAVGTDQDRDDDENDLDGGNDNKGNQGRDEEKKDYEMLDQLVEKDIDFGDGNDDMFDKQKGGRESIVEPFNIDALRISMVPKQDGLRDSTELMEQLLKDQIGGSEAKYRKITQIIEKFKGKGDIYYEKYEDKLIKQLDAEVFKYEPVDSSDTSYQKAQEFLQQYQSFMLLKQGMIGAGGANQFYYGIGETYFNTNLGY